MVWGTTPWGPLKCARWQLIFFRLKLARCFLLRLVARCLMNILTLFGSSLSGDLIYFKIIKEKL